MNGVSSADGAMEAGLLYGAYERMGLNLVMAVAVTVVFGPVLMQFFPSKVIALWMGAILGMAIVGYGIWHAFRRAQPHEDALTPWRALYLGQVFFAGLAWAAGPLLLIPTASGADMALFVVILLGVCVVSMVTMAEQQQAMQAFIVGVLLPPAASLAYHGGGIERMVAASLVCGAAMTIVAGRTFHKVTRDLLQLVSERKRDDEAMRTFERIVEQSEVAVAVTDTRGDIRYVNPGFERTTGYARAEVIGRNPKFLRSGETPSATYAELWRTLASGNTWRGEFRNMRKDGMPYWGFTSISPVYNEAGELINYVSVQEDITARKETEQSLIAAREAADRANRAKSDFLSSMSHELRTPMNAILGFAQMLESDSELNADQQDSVYEILRGGRHLLELINEVLDLAKIESGNITLSLEPVVLAPLIEDCRQFILPLAAQRDVSLSLEVPPNMVVRADRVRLKQVVLNLLSNAVKYNRPGGDIRLGVESHHDGLVRICVTDTGRGMSREAMAGLFQPYSRLGAENSGIEGTGIGLTITRRLVDLMAGDIGVTSQLGVGSTFWFDLPSDSFVADEAHSDSNAGETQVVAAGRQFKVLCVDDNPVNLKLISHALSKRAHLSIFTAHTPTLGIELALVHRPDLILLDINMPGMDGFQVLEVLKADTKLKTIPVIAVTANAMLRDIERGRAAGFADYVTKPFNVGQFLSTVDRCLLGERK